MDSPISSHSSSSSSTLTMSPQVFSPCPIKACYSKKNNLDSVRFFDLMDDLGQLSLNRASSYPVEKLCKTSIEDTDDNEFERSALRRSFGELERKSITSHFYMNEVDSEAMMTAPIRASNPQIYDQRFAQMDQMDQQIGFSAREKKTYTKIQKVLNWV